MARRFGILQAAVRDEPSAVAPARSGRAKLLTMLPFALGRPYHHCRAQGGTRVSPDLGETDKKRLLSAAPAPGSLR